MARGMDGGEGAGAVSLRDGTDDWGVRAASAHRGGRDSAGAKHRARGDGGREEGASFGRDSGDEAELPVHGARVRAGKGARRGGQDEVRGGGELGRIVESAGDECGARNVRGEEEDSRELLGTAG